MACGNNILKIVSGDSKNLSVIISKGDKPLNAKLTSDISGTITSIPVTVKNSSVLVPGVGHIVLYDAAGNSQTIAYTAVTAVTGKTYTLTVASTVLDNDLFTGYRVIIDGGRVDITSDTIVFEAKDSDDVAVITRNATILDGPSGQAVIALSISDTDITVGQYTYSIEWQTFAGGVTTMITSILQIEEDIVD